MRGGERQPVDDFELQLYDWSAAGATSRTDSSRHPRASTVAPRSQASRMPYNSESSDRLVSELIDISEQVAVLQDWWASMDGGAGDQGGSRTFKGVVQFLVEKKVLNDEVQATKYVLQKLDKPRKALD